MAANTEMIDALVSDSALKSLDTLNTKLTSSYTEMEKLLTKVQALSTELSKPAKDYIELSKAIENQKKLEQELVKVEEAHTKSLKELEELRKKVIDTNSKEVESVKQVTKSYTESSKAIADHGKTLKEISKEAYNIAKSTANDNIKALIELKKTYAVLEKQMQGLKREYDAGLISKNEYISKTTVLSRDVNDQKKAIKQLSTEIELNNKIIDSQVGSYNNLSAQYSRIKIQINQMSEAEKYNGYTKKELEAHAKSLYEEMSNMQKATGKAQLDVGKYDKAMGDLTTTLRMVDPTLGTIVGRIQNISGVKKVWISWNEKLTSSLGMTAKAATVLQVALVALAVGGIYFAIKWLKEWNDEQERAQTVSSETMKKINDSAASIASSQRALYERLRQEWIATNGSLKEQEILVKKNKDAYNNLGVEITSVTDADKIFIEYADKFVASINKRALASAAMGLASEKYKESIQKMLEADEKINNPSSWDKYKATLLEFVGLGDRMDILGEMMGDQADTLRTEATRAQTAAVQFIRTALDMNSDIDEELSKLGIKKHDKDADKLLQDKLKKQLQAAEAEKKAQSDLAQFRYNIEVDAQKKILENNKESYLDRIDAVDEYEEKRLEAIEAARVAQLDNENLTASQVMLINEKAEAEKDRITEEAAQYRLDIAKDYFQRQADIMNESLSNINNGLSISESNDLSLLSQQLADGVITLEEYEKQKLKITKKYALERMQAEIDSLKNMLGVSNISEEDAAKIRQKIQEAELSYTKYINDQEIKDNERKNKEKLKQEEDYARKKAELAKELGQAVMDFLSTLYEADTERKLSKLEAEAEANQEWRDTEMERIEENVEAGLMSEEEADARKAIIEETAREREKQIEAEKSEVKKRQAKYEKAQAMLSIAVSTAMGIAKAVAEFPITGGMPFAAIVAAIGAIQLANVAAQPIPAYAKGTDNHPGGLAKVGDGGRSEMVILPSGHIWKTPAIDTLVNLPRGTEVLPDYRQAMMSMFATPSLSYYDDNIGQTVFMNDEVLRSNTKETNNQLKFISKSVGAIHANNIYSGKKNYSGFKTINNKFI